MTPLQTSNQFANRFAAIEEVLRAAVGIGMVAVFTSMPSCRQSVANVGSASSLSLSSKNHRLEAYATNNCLLIAAMDDIAKALCFCKNGRGRQPFGKTEH